MLGLSFATHYHFTAKSPANPFNYMLVSKLPRLLQKPHLLDKIALFEREASRAFITLIFQKSPFFASDRLNPKTQINNKLIMIYYNLLNNN